MMEGGGVAELSGMATPLGGVSDNERVVEGAIDVGAAVPVAVLRAGVAVEDMNVAEGTNGFALTLRAEPTTAAVGAKGDE